MNTQALIGVGKEVIDKIKSTVANNDWLEFKRLSDTPQPNEWIKEAKSQEGGVFYFNDIELIEALCEECFGSSVYVIKSVSHHQDKGQFAVTAHIAYGTFLQQLHGVATVYSPTIQQLELATPKAPQMAFKNAVRKLGKLFGQDLNRHLEDERSNDGIVVTDLSDREKHEEKKIELERELTKNLIKESKEREVAEAVLKASGFIHDSELINLINNKF